MIAACWASFEPKRRYWGRYHQPLVIQDRTTYDRLYLDTEGACHPMVMILVGHKVHVPGRSTYFESRRYSHQTTRSCHPSTGQPYDPASHTTQFDLHLKPNFCIRMTLLFVYKINLESLIFKYIYICKFKIFKNLIFLYSSTNQFFC